MLKEVSRRARARLNDLDQLFVLLRGVTLTGGLFWLLVGPANPQRRVWLIILFVIFVSYGLALYGFLLFGSIKKDRLYLIALFVDFSFIAALVSLTGAHQSIFILAFYLLIGLHAFYFGLRVGLMVAVMASTFYLMLNAVIGPESWVDETLKVGFMLLTGIASGLISEKEKRDKQQIEQLVKELQAARRVIEHSEKIALLGRLSAGIAHAINNPVSVIATRSERMLLEAKEADRAAPGQDALIRDLEVINAHAHRVATIVGNMLAFSRQRALHMTALDINEIVETAVSLVEHRLPEKRLTLNLNLLRHLPHVRGDAGRLQEVLVNILNNAIEASYEGGQIYILSTLSGGPQKELQIFVTDTGVGIPEEDRDKVFDPFFTTKEVGQGTGLGLYVAYQIIKEHGGTITLDSEVGKGTTVTISLPLPSWE